MSERHSELKVIRWADRIQDILAGEVRGPIRANLDLTNLCGHKCFFCEPVEFREATIRDRRHTLDFETAALALLDLTNLGCQCVQFSGGGEPLLHPEFGSLLYAAKTNSVRTVVITNGGQIHKWVPYLVGAADHVRVSLDASCPEEHIAAHGTKPDEFNRVVENIRALMAERGQNISPEVGLAYIVTDANGSAESIRRVLAIASELRVDYVQFRPISEEQPTALTEGWPAVYERIEIVRTAFPWVPVFVTGQRLRDVFTQRKFQKCYAASTLAVIGANGDVSACCDRRDIVFGNVHEKRFRDIWLSAEHRDKAEHIVPQFCGRCLQCGTNRGIERFVVNNEALAEVI